MVKPPVVAPGKARKGLLGIAATSVAIQASRPRSASRTAAPITGVVGAVAPIGGGARSNNIGDCKRKLALINYTCVLFSGLHIVLARVLCHAQKQFGVQNGVMQNGKFIVGTTQQEKLTIEMCSVASNFSGETV